jgi:hypothetical protein
VNLKARATALRKATRCHIVLDRGAPQKHVWLQRSGKSKPVVAGAVHCQMDGLVRDETRKRDKEPPPEKVPGTDSPYERGQVKFPEEVDRK